MERKTGKKIFSGIAIGKIKFYDKADRTVARINVENAEAEIARYKAARGTAIEQLNNLYETAMEVVGAEEAEIFHGHAMMLNDDVFCESVCSIIATQHVKAEYAVQVTGNNLAEIFEQMDDDYLKARCADVKDITTRVIAILSGEAASCDIGEEPVIVAADDLSPGELVWMDRKRLLALVVHRTSVNAHTAILAKTMGIPALTDVKVEEAWNGRIGIVDGKEGVFVVDPDEALLEEYEKKKAADDAHKELLKTFKGKENVTKSGRKIRLCANIGGLNDLASVVENDADGIGLFRTEFLYAESKTYPSEDEQFAVYRKVVEAMGQKKVMIRTLDAGADKQIDYFAWDQEKNPALGFRGIRICLARPEIFRVQLRALFRASAYGNLAILYPMIISRDEVQRIRAISKSVREELIAQGVDVGEVEEGIMIETPAAAIMSDVLAGEVDFFCIGTNDLTQYTLAVDRQNTKLDDFYDRYHPAVLRLVQMTVENAHKHGKPVGICGELGADTTLTETFLKMGVDELSVSPEQILEIRKTIRELE